jgi:predicted HicB family RNase H-like nuclease
MNSEHYAYRVIWSEEDQEFVGLCAEFPSLSWLEKDQEAALRGIVALVKDTVADMEAEGEKIPEPLALQKYSGKFQVRTTPEMHRRLAMQAAEAGVSLNRFINSRLAEHNFS